jgi:hypothetical protein
VTGDDYERLEREAREHGPASAFDALERRALDQRDYPLLFDVLLMRRRHELGLPLLLHEPGALAGDARRDYEAACVEAARRVGRLFLDGGEIARAWPYFRAIGETGPIVEAIDRLPPDANPDGVIEIAYQEALHPRKGFEMVLAHHGICRAITVFSQYPGGDGRAESLALLVRTLHEELDGNLRRAIREREGDEPEERDIPSLIRDRPWLFGEYNYYVDTSHVTAVLQLAREAEDRQTLVRAVEIAEYGKRLAPMFHYRGEPPFEDVYADSAVYLRALAGEEVEAAIAHFRAKVASADPELTGTAPAQALVGLLVRLKRYREAADAWLEFLGDADPRYLACPSAAQLCQMAGDFERLKRLGRERGNVLEFVAGAIQEQGRGS